ncbi:MAG: hypothetical protein SGPRY_004472 [Prymnesium sp.]
MGIPCMRCVLLSASLLGSRAYVVPPSSVGTRASMATPRVSPPHATASDDPRPGFRFASRPVRDAQTGRESVKLALEAVDPRNVVRAVNVSLTPAPGLGIELEELTGSGFSADGLPLQGQLVVVRSLVAGGVAQAEGSIRAGDTITAVGFAGSFVDTEACSYDALMETLQAAVELGDPITLTMKRVVARGRATVTAVLPGGEKAAFTAYEGENLRMCLIRQGLVVNDETANRYDNKPAGTGNCGGNGLCCTCVVSVQGGAQHFSPMRPSERQLLRKVARWRQSCRTKFVLEDGEEAEVSINLSPRAK